jgi:hypothetical protein
MGPYAGVDLTSSYVHSKVDSNTFTMNNPMPKSTSTLCQSRFYPPVRDFGFGIRKWSSLNFDLCHLAMRQGLN